MFKNVLIRASNNTRLLFRNWKNYETYGSNLFLDTKPLYYSFKPGRLTFQMNTLPAQILRYKHTESTNTTIRETSPSGDICAKTTPPLTRGEKLKKAVKEYGSTVIIFHITISLASLGTCYLLVTSGLDVHKIYTTLGLEDWLGKSQIAANAGTFAVAYAIHKVFAPVRIGITLTTVPFIVRHLRKIGFLKK